MDLSQLSNEELLRMFQAAAGTAISAKPDVSDIGPLQAGAIGMGKTLTRMGQGVQQGYYALTGNQEGAAKLKADVDEENRLYDPLKQARPYSTGIGEALPAMAIPVGGAASVPAAIGKAAIQNAIPGALEYGTLEERAKNAGIGAAGGAIGGAAGTVLGRALNPVRGEGQAAIAARTGLADKLDIPLTAGQATGSKPLQYLESALANLPGSAGRMQNVARGQQDALNAAVMRTAGGTGKEVTNEAVTAARQAVGSDIGNIASSITLQVDNTLLGDLSKVETAYMRRLTPDIKPVVRSYIDDILNYGSGMPGDIYQAARSDLGRHAASLPDGSPQALALKGIQKSLDRAWDRAANQTLAADMAAARAKYTAAKTIDKMVTASGDVTPAKVAQVAKRSPGSLGDVAKLAADIKPLPDSGTAQRSFWMNLLTRNPMEQLAPANLMAMTGAPYAAASFMTRGGPFGMPGGKDYLTRGLLGVTPDVEEKLIRYGGLFGAGLLGGPQY